MLKESGTTTTRPLGTDPFNREVIPSRIKGLDFPGGAVVESLPANAGDAGSGHGLGGSHMPQSN